MLWGNLDEEEIMDTYRNVAETVFDGRVLNAMKDENNNVSIPDYDPPLRKTEDAVFRLYYRLLVQSIYNKTLRHQARSLKENAAQLIMQLKKEYHLKFK